MTDSSNDPDPLDDLVAEFRRMPLPDRPPDDAVLARLGLASSAAPTPTPTGRRAPQPSRSLRRLLMRPTVRYATAATVLFGALGWLALMQGSGALADVIKAAEQHTLARFKMKQVTDDRRNGSAEGLSTVYVDLKSPRLRIEASGKTFNRVLEFESVQVQDCRQGRFLNQLSQVQIVQEKDAEDESQAIAARVAAEGGHAKKVADIYPVGNEDIKPFSDINAERTFLDTLRDFQAGEGTTSFKTKLDGRDVIKYRREEDKKTSTLWVDAATKLPVRIEYEMIDPTPQIARNKWVYTEFEWDPAGTDPERLFSTEPAEGFTVHDHTNEK